MKNNLAWPRCLEIFYLGCHSLLQSFPESSSSSQGISQGWAVSADNDVASDSRCRTTCLFQASGFLLYFDKNIRAEIWHFQSPAPTQRQGPLSGSLLISNRAKTWTQVCLWNTLFWPHHTSDSPGLLKGPFLAHCTISIRTTYHRQSQGAMPFSSQAFFPPSSLCFLKQLFLYFI